MCREWVFFWKDLAHLPWSQGSTGVSESWMQWEFHTEEGEWERERELPGIQFVCDFSGHSEVWPRMDRRCVPGVPEVPASSHWEHSQSCHEKRALPPPSHQCGASCKQVALQDPTRKRLEFYEGRCSFCVNNITFYDGKPSPLRFMEKHRLRLL